MFFRGLGPGTPLFELGRPMASGMQSSFPILVDFGPETSYPHVFGHDYYNVCVWPVKRYHIGIFHVRMGHMDIVDNVSSVNGVDNVSSVNREHNVHNEVASVATEAQNRRTRGPESYF